jgi:hypothetical protein
VHWAKLGEARQVIFERDGQVPPPTDFQLGFDQFEQTAATKRILDRRQESPQIDEVAVGLAPGPLQRLALLFQADPIARSVKGPLPFAEITGNPPLGSTRLEYRPIV